MDYLTEREKKVVVYSDRNSFPPRVLSPVEEEIARLIHIYNFQTDGATAEKVRGEEIQHSLARLEELTASTRLSDKFRKALVHPTYFEDVTEDYPYAKYSDIINGKHRHSAIERLAMDRFSADGIRTLIGWIVSLVKLFEEELPKGVTRFVWTDYTKFFRTRWIAQQTGDASFYGISLPEAVQDKVTALFGESRITDYCVGNPSWALAHIRRYGIHKDQYLLPRMAFPELALKLHGGDLFLEFHEEFVTGLTIHYLELTQPSTATSLRFIIEG